MNNDNTTPSHSEETETTENTGKHTPTPWRISEHDKTKVFAEENTLVMRTFHYEGVFAKQYHRKKVNGSDLPACTEAMSNAQLIVTAVNSYSTLKAEVAQLKTYVNDNRLHAERLQSDNEAKEKRINELESLLKRAYDDFSPMSVHDKIRQEIIRTLTPKQ